jgi:hypothetical protein
MAYCGICGRHHDPGAGCFDGTNQALKDTGIDTLHRPPDADFRQIAKQADRWIVKVLLWILVIIVLVMVLYALGKKTY